MLADTLIFVSKRLQRPAAAVICLIAARLFLALAAPSEPAEAGSVRMPISPAPSAQHP